MRILRFTLHIFILCLVVTACKKDDKIETPNLPDPLQEKHKYYPLEVGNFWVYKLFEIDNLSNEIELNQTDSCFIAKDTIIRGIKYYKLSEPNIDHSRKYTFIRDSADYIINSFGQKLFSEIKMNELLYETFITIRDSTHEDPIAKIDTVCKVERRMDQIPLQTITPAGIFNTLNSKEVFEFYPNWSYSGKSRSKSKKYANEVGIVLETLPFVMSNTKYTERRLIRFHLN